MISNEKNNKLLKDIKNFYNVKNNLDTYKHVLKAAKISEELALKFNLDSTKCYLAGLLHDISTYLSPNEMLLYADKHNWSINEIENEYPNLLHQRISSNMANQLFDITDLDILNSIKCHTTLKNNPDKFEMVLFIADKLSWGEETAFYKQVSVDLNNSIQQACLTYINLAIEYRLILKPHPDLLEAKDYFEKNYNL